MGELSRSNGTERRILLNQHLVGRGVECALRLSGTYVSSQHALIRWQGSAWELIDRGSRNGTRLDGAAVEPGRPYTLARGSSICFGHPDESWLLADASEPRIMAVSLEDGEAHTEAHGLIGLPSNTDPEGTLYRDVDGTWKLELVDGNVRSVADGETFECGGRRYRLCLPALAERTASLGDVAPFDQPSLRFSVSSDEEFVELELHFATRTVSLGSRAHNYLLLTLARAYLADIESGAPPASSGWVDKETLGRGLQMSPEQIDGEVFRVRKHFARHGLKEAAVIIERRPRTKQIRLGVRSVRVDRR
jgi:hypothetical protein